MTPAASIALVESFWDEVWAARNLLRSTRFVTEDFIISTAGVDVGGPWTSRRGLPDFNRPSPKSGALNRTKQQEAAGGIEPPIWGFAGALPGSVDVHSSPSLQLIGQLSSRQSEAIRLSCGITVA